MPSIISYLAGFVGPCHSLTKDSAVCGAVPSPGKGQCCCMDLSLTKGSADIGFVGGGGGGGAIP